MSAHVLCRYLELVYPIWHKTHFKMRYIYITIVFVWMFGLVEVVEVIPTSKVGNLMILNLIKLFMKKIQANIFCFDAITYRKNGVFF